MSPHWSRAQTTVEFALAIPIILVLFMSTVEGGRTIFTFAMLHEAARVGARTGSLPCTGTGTPPQCAKQNTVNATTKVGGLVGLTDSEVKLFVNGAEVTGSYTKIRGQDVEVDLAHNFTFIIGKIQYWPLSSFTMTVKTKMRAEG